MLDSRSKGTEKSAKVSAASHIIQLEKCGVAKARSCSNPSPSLGLIIDDEEKEMTEAKRFKI